MTIYIHGCECGINGVYIRRIKKAYPSCEVINSKYSEQDREVHAQYLEGLDLSLANYLPVVVNGNSVQLLKQWKP